MSLFLLAIGMVGCGGGGQGDVRGTVKFKGEPLPSGRITFIGKQDSKSAPILEGSYNAFGVPAGPVKVTIESTGSTAVAKGGKAKKSNVSLEGSNAPNLPPPKGLLPPAILAQARDKQAAQQTGEDVPKLVPIPKRYNDPEQSELSLTVTKGKQEFNVELTP